MLSKGYALTQDTYIRFESVEMSARFSREFLNRFIENLATSARYDDLIACSAKRFCNRATDPRSPPVTSAMGLFPAADPALITIIPPRSRLCTA